MAEAGSGAPGESYKPTFDLQHADFSIDDVQYELYERGVAVVHNVISAADCDLHVGQVRDWLSSFGGKFPNNFSSLIHQYNISHLEPVWRARLSAKALFSQLWSTEKLMSSMDGIAIGRPPEDGDTDFGDAIPRKGLHFDQGVTRHGLHAYQGALYLQEALEDDWCFVVMEKSHKLLREFFQKHDKGRSEHRKLTADEIAWLEQKGCDIQRVAVPKGGMVLWDSRTVHAGAPPIRGRLNPGRWRYVFFICQTPAIWATPGDIEVKKEAYERLLISRHWASNGVGNFKYEASGFDITELPPCAKSDEVKKLAGVMPYDFKDGQPNGPKWKPKWN